MSSLPAQIATAAALFTGTNLDDVVVITVLSAASRASAAARCAVRSASILVDDGSDVPAVTTTRVNVSLIAFP